MPIKDPLQGSSDMPHVPPSTLLAEIRLFSQSVGNGMIWSAAARPSMSLVKLRLEVRGATQRFTAAPGFSFARGAGWGSSTGDWPLVERPIDMATPIGSAQLRYVAMSNADATQREHGHDFDIVHVAALRHGDAPSIN
jgi:hypothetical protein